MKEWGKALELLADQGGSVVLTGMWWRWMQEVLAHMRSSVGPVQSQTELCPWCVLGWMVSGHGQHVQGSWCNNPHHLLGYTVWWGWSAVHIEAIHP